MQDPIRFTPEEIEELVKSGELTEADLKLLHPQDAKLAGFLIMKPKGEQAQDMAMGMLVGGGGLDVTKIASSPLGKAVAGKAIPAVKAAGNFAIDQAPRIGGAIGGALGAAVKHPFAGRAAGYALGDKVRDFFGRTKGAVKPAPAAPSGPGPFTGTGGGNGSPVLPGGGRVSGPGQMGGFSTKPSTSAPQNFGNGPSGPKKGPDITRQRSMEDVAERVVDRGIQVEGQMLPRYTSNVTTESSFDEIMEMLLRSSSMGAPSPLKFHPSAPDGMRSSVDKLKRTTKRRSPK